MLGAAFPILTFTYATIAAAGLLFLMIGLAHPRLLRFAAFTAAFVPVFNPAIIHISKNLRVVSVPIVAVLWASERKPLIPYRGKLFQATLLFAAIGLPLGFLGIKATTSIANVILLLVAAVTMWVFVSASGPEGLRQTLIDFCGATVVISAALGFAHYGDAIASDGRWLGLFINANSLGLVAAIAVVTGRRWRSPVYLTVLACSAVCIDQSGSRASALAVVFGLALFALRPWQKFRRLIVLAVVCLAVPLTVSTLRGADLSTPSQSSASMQGLFRSTNSRAQAWGQAVDYIRVKPYTGYGIGNEQGQPADAFLKAFEELGFFALFPLILLLGDSFLIFRQREELLKPVFVVLLVEGIFESWLFAAGNPFFLVFLAVSLGLAAQRPGRTKTLRPSTQPAVSSPTPRRPRLESAQPVKESDQRSDLTSLWDAPAAFTPPPSVADPTPAIDTSAVAVGRRGLAILADQAFSSLQNYLILIFALRSLDLVHFGEFSIAYTAMFVVVGIVRALIFEPFTIRFTTASPELRRQAGRDATGASLSAGVILGLSCLASAFIIPSGPVHYLLIAFAVALPIMLLQDAWRMFLFASGRPWSATINDASCLLATAPLIAVAAVLLKLTPGLLVGIWAGGTAVGALLGLVQTRIRPRFSGGGRWLRHTKDLAFSLAGASIASSGLAIISYSMIALVVSVTAVGQLGASIAIMAPVTTFVTATVLFLLPEAARWRREGRRKVIGSSATMSVGLVVVVLAAAGVISVLPGACTHLLAGPNWHIARHLLLPVAIWIAASAARQAPASALRALGQGRKVFYLSIVNGIAIMVGALGGGAVGGAQGAAWGYAASETATVALWWMTLATIHWAPDSSSVSLAQPVRTYG